MKVRTSFQPTEELEVSEQEAAMLKHNRLLFEGTDEELAGHYVAAGLELPAGIKPAAAAGGKTEQSKTEQAKGA